MLYKFSPSTLNILKECPRCFWLHFNKGIKRPDSIFPSLPGGMDKILKAHFDSYIGKDNLPPEIKELKGVKLFDNLALLNVWRSNFKGLQYKNDEGQLLKGAIDNLLVKGKKFIVLDYKTRGYPLKEDTHEHYQDQLDTYNFLLRKNGYKTEDYAYLLFYHPNKVNEQGDVIFNTDLVKMKVDAKNAEEIFNRAIFILKHDLPLAADDCQYCKYRYSR